MALAARRPGERMKKRGYHMENFSLQVEKRNASGQRPAICGRRAWVPAVVYGGAEPAEHLQTDERELDRVLDKGGAASLLNWMAQTFPRPAC
jgi:hypothetical protein